MNTPSNTQAQTEQQTPLVSNRKSLQNPSSLSDLIGFEVPNLRRHFPTHNEIAYILDGTADDLKQLKSATSNASELIFSGIEAVTDLLMTIELNQGEFEFNLASQTKIDALALVNELSKIMRVVNETEWLLDRATPTKDQA